MPQCGANRYGRGVGCKLFLTRQPDHSYVECVDTVVGRISANILARKKQCEFEDFKDLAPMLPLYVRLSSSQTEAAVSKEPEDQDTVGDEPTPTSNDAIIIQAKELFQGQSEVWIELGDEMYRLRLTSSGKLYLTK